MQVPEREWCRQALKETLNLLNRLGGLLPLVLCSDVPLLGGGGGGFLIPRRPCPDATSPYKSWLRSQLLSELLPIVAFSPAT